jgi:hypothetical protein
VLGRESLLLASPWTNWPEGRSIREDLIRRPNFDARLESGRTARILWISLGPCQAIILTLNMAFIPKIPELTKEGLEFIAQIDRRSCNWAGRGEKDSAAGTGPGHSHIQERLKPFRA